MTSRARWSCQVWARSATRSRRQLPRLPNPAGNIIRRVDGVLEDVDGVLGRVDTTLSSVDGTLKQVEGTHSAVTRS